MTVYEGVDIAFGAPYTYASRDILQDLSNYRMRA